jgi:hypothetical protein
MDGFFKRIGKMMAAMADAFRREPEHFLKIRILRITRLALGVRVATFGPSDV